VPEGENMRTSAAGRTKFAFAESINPVSIVENKNAEMIISANVVLFISTN
jgi:hypothetical protein